MDAATLDVSVHREFARAQDVTKCTDSSQMEKALGNCELSEGTRPQSKNVASRLLCHMHGAARASARHRRPGALLPHTGRDPESEPKAEMLGMTCQL